MAQEKISYSKAIAELEEIVEKMESNQYEIDELTSKVKRVAELVKFCKQKLRTTNAEIQKVFDELNEDQD